MLDVFKNMYQLHLDIADPAAFDQGLWNFTARSEPFKKYFSDTENQEGFVATGWPEKAATFMPYTSDDPPVWNWQDMICYAQLPGVPFSIVHQYDRSSLWASQIRNIFQEHRYSTLDPYRILRSVAPQRDQSSCARYLG